MRHGDHVIRLLGHAGNPLTGLPGNKVKPKVEFDPLKIFLDLLRSTKKHFTLFFGVFMRTDPVKSVITGRRFVRHTCS